MEGLFEAEGDAQSGLKPDSELERLPDGCFA
jgi:hypothetical protein